MERLVTFSELSEMLGISISRLYDLIREGVFPEPLRNPSNNRPYFNAELTEACHLVVKTRLGVNGLPYTPNRKRKAGNGTVTRRDRHESLILALGGLGVTATAKQVDEALRHLPDAGKGLADSALIKQVFLRLRRND